MSNAGHGRSTSRRQFIRNSSLGGVGLAVSPASPNGSAAAEQGSANASSTIPLRPLGRAQVQVSILGMGGHHLGDITDADETMRLVQTAVDAGITFFDNCWEYYNGRTEELLGRGLHGRRDKVFLMTKVCTHGRGADLAMRMLEQALRRLQTDHLNLWQIHAISYDNDPDLAYANPTPQRKWTSCAPGARRRPPTAGLNLIRARSSSTIPGPGCRQRRRH